MVLRRSSTTVHWWSPLARESDPVDLDVLVAEESREPFTFRLGGRDWSLPHISDLTLRQMRAVDSGNLIDVVREVGGDELADLLLDSKGTATAALHVNWLRHAGVGQGE